MNWIKKWLFVSIGILTSMIYGQSSDQNYTMTVVPKYAMGINEIDDLVSSASAPASLTITDQRANETLVRSQAITLGVGAHILPNTTLKIVDAEAINDNVYRDITYYDGLGRPMQSIAVGQNPGGKDIVQHYAYDQFGRTEKSYLPFAANQSNGNLVINPVSQINTYYQNKYGDSNPFAQQRFDNSPLSRVLESASPGNAWQLLESSDSDHTVKYGYLSNAENEVKRYDVQSDGSFTTSYYAKNELMKRVVKNENWQPSDGKLNTSETFTDKTGKVIAEISYEGDGSNISKLITAYIYDTQGRLKFTLPPKSSTRDFGEVNSDRRFSWNYTKLLPDSFPGGGGGSASLRIENGVLTFSAGAGFNLEILKLGVIAFIHSDLPDIDLGYMLPDQGPSGNYIAYLEGGYLKVRHTGWPRSIKNLSFSLTANVGDIQIPTDQEFINDLTFQYEYDDYNREIAQKTPGRGWEYVVYDQLDRPILIQDALLKKDNQWLFTKYDQFGRPIYTGKYNSSSDRAALQTVVDDFINAASNTNKANSESRISGTSNIGGVSISYSNNAFPKTGIAELLTVNYFDDYAFNDPDKPATPTSVKGRSVTQNTKGLPTGGWVKTLGTNSWTKSYTYYDEKGRSLKLYEKNHLGGYTTSESELDFRGKVIESTTQHKRQSTDAILTINDRYEYDTNERVLASYQQINNQAEERLASLSYDELGQVSSKSVGGTASGSGLQTITYQHNIRGWMTEVNDVDNLGSTLFAYKINYNTPLEGATTSASPLFTGNIAQTIWKSKHDNLKKSYTYQYDKLHRLTDAYYLSGTSLTRGANNRFETHGINYDLNGNITTLQRNGLSGTMDQLTYNYGGGMSNQLMSITDTANTNQGFVDGNTNGDDYEYDENGNLIKDLNKNISSIEYNHLDLVKKVIFNNGKYLEFTYDASGKKLSKIYVDGQLIVQSDYLGGFQYLGGQLQFFPSDEGYVYKNSSSNSFKYVYMMSDHLGNNRVTYSDTNGDGTISSAELLSNSDYYPMGLIHSGEFTSALASDFDYKFQGKELQEENNVLLYDFGSRMYDPTVGRWFNTDPQNQFGSPYLAMGNNWPNGIDPDGEFFGTLITSLTETIQNVFSHGVNVDHYDYDRTERAWEIDKGLFQTNPNKTFLGQGLELFSRFTWQAPQTLVGNVASHGLNITGNVNAVHHFDGATVLDTDLSGGAFTVGSYIIGPRNFRPNFRDHLFVHEYGHYLQSQRLGPLYFPLVALPSVTDSWLVDEAFGEDLHHTRWYEVGASRLAANYFDRHYGSGADGYIAGDADFFDRNSFVNEGILSPYRNPRTLAFNVGGHPLRSRFHWTDIPINGLFSGGLGLFGYLFN